MTRWSLERVSSLNFMQLMRSFFCLLVSPFPPFILLMVSLFLLTEFMVMLRESDMTSLGLEIFSVKFGSEVMMEKQSCWCNV